MFKKVFALASVTALAGFVAAVSAAGCSSTTIEGGGEGDGSSDARREGNRREAGDVELCYTNDPVAYANFIYKRAKVEPGACTAQDIAGLAAFIEKNPKATFDDLQTEIAKLPAACNSCIVGDVGDPSWTPLLTKDGKIATINSSGCVEIVSGKGEACGKAHRQWDQCINEACGLCESDAEIAACQEDTQTTACAAATEALGEACGRKEINGYLEACRRFDTWLTKHCVTGGASGDGGTDAAADAPSDG